MGRLSPIESGLVAFDDAFQTLSLGRAEFLKAGVEQKLLVIFIEVLRHHTPVESTEIASLASLAANPGAHAVQVDYAEMAVGRQAFAVEKKMPDLEVGEGDVQFVQGPDQLTHSYEDILLPVAFEVPPVVDDEIAQAYTLDFLGDEERVSLDTPVRPLPHAHRFIGADVVREQMLGVVPFDASLGGPGAASASRRKYVLEMGVLETLHEEGATLRIPAKDQPLNIPPMMFVHRRCISVLVEIVEFLEPQLREVRLPRAGKKNPIHSYECLSNNTVPVSGP